ncbi:helix-turn-helix domain-containing protein [Bacillus thuringiensis]|jgi:hypothetical protein|uniref:helix-turn-helix domain-containing protein n=1 Tax=Bacillus thuringiensis TaxID=1428 RepID=UPI001145AB30
MSYQTKVTDEVRAQIKRSGLSQTKFAVRAGISPNKLVRCLSGQTRWALADLEQLADAGVRISLQIGEDK